MKPYHKIQSVFKRDMEAKGHPFIEGEWACPEFEYLAGLEWEWTEKIDGTNVRIIWDGERVEFRGKTDRAQMPPHLLARLGELFPADKFVTDEPMTLYGEGYGHKIQKGGKYLPDKRVDFILFDVRVGHWWLRRGDVEDIAHQMGIRVVPPLILCPIHEAITRIKEGVKSTFGDFLAEGLVGRPRVELKARSGERIITKLKHRDFPRATP